MPRAAFALATHVRRGDTAPEVSGIVARRIAAALDRGGWPSLERACQRTVEVHGRPVGAAQATAHLRAVVEERGAVVHEVITGRDQVVATPDDAGGGPLAVLFGVEDERVSSLHVLVGDGDGAPAG